MRGVGHHSGGQGVEREEIRDLAAASSLGIGSPRFLHHKAIDNVVSGQKPVSEVSLRERGGEVKFGQVLKEKVKIIHNQLATMVSNILQDALGYCAVRKWKSRMLKILFD